MTLREILAKKDAIKAEMRSINDTASGNGELEGPAQARFATLVAEAAALTAAEARTAAIDDLDRRSALGAPLGDNRFDAETRTIGVLDVLRAQVFPGSTDAMSGRVREMSRHLELRSGRRADGLLWDMRGALQTRALTSGQQSTDTNGAALVPTVLHTEAFIDRLRNATVVRNLGAVVLSDLNGLCDVPRRSQSVTASWFGEDQVIPESTGAFDRVSLRPRHCGAITEISLNLIQQTSPDIEMIVQMDLARTMAESLDAAALFGAGDGVTPLGVLNTPGVNRYSFGNAAPSWAGVLSMIANVEGANTAMVSPAWVGGALVKAKAMATQKNPAANGASLGYVMDVPGQLAGYRYASTNSLPVTAAAGSVPALSSLIFGDFSDLLIGLWGEVDISANSQAESVYRKGSALVRSILTCDVAVRHATSFSVATDVAA
ncbi:MAG: phage major capsid protein [Janthinobacterium lividum]